LLITYGTAPSPVKAVAVACDQMIRSAREPSDDTLCSIVARCRQRSIRLARSFRPGRVVLCVFGCGLRLDDDLADHAAGALGAAGVEDAVVGVLARGGEGQLVD